MSAANGDVSSNEVALKALQKLLDAVDVVVAFDWSDNDQDAHDAICDLRKAARDYATVVRISDEHSADETTERPVFTARCEDQPCTKCQKPLSEHDLSTAYCSVETKARHPSANPCRISRNPATDTYQCIEHEYDLSHQGAQCLGLQPVKASGKP